MAWSVGRPSRRKNEPGILPGGVHALLDVDGEGEEVDALTDALGGGGGDEHDGVADADDDGAVGLAGQLAGLEGQGLVGAADGTRDTEWLPPWDVSFWGPRSPDRGGRAAGPVPSW